MRVLARSGREYNVSGDVLHLFLLRLVFPSFLGCVTLPRSAIVCRFLRIFSRLFAGVWVAGVWIAGHPISDDAQFLREERVLRLAWCRHIQFVLLHLARFTKKKGVASDV